MEQRISIERMEQAVNLFGSFDENVRLIESEFKVTISNREGELRVNGEVEDTMLAVKALNAFVKVAVEALRGDEKILLTGLGTFSTVRYPERMGRNPRTGAPVRIPARRAVRFRPSRTIED